MSNRGPTPIIEQVNHLFIKAEANPAVFEADLIKFIHDNLIELLNHENGISFIHRFKTSQLNLLLIKLEIEQQLPELIRAFPGMLSKEVLGFFISEIAFERFGREMPDLFFSNDLQEELFEEKFSERMVIVYNNEGYFDQEPKASALTKFIKGAALSFEKEGSSVPIGYNVFLPNDNQLPSQVMVVIYGGKRKSLQGENIFQPDTYPDKLERYLLNRGTAIITLNLPDLLKLETEQALMPEQLYNEIHACINHCFHTLSHPEHLHPLLEILKDKPIFLFGKSFGGTMAIRHAQMYPNTFAGYISHDGDLHAKISSQSDRIKRAPLSPWLDASDADAIAKIQDPILLMQNRDDHNVNAKITLSFYKKLSEMQKTELARICITPSGSPMRSKGLKLLKGHFYPEKFSQFKRYGKTVELFLTKGPSSLDSISLWRGFSENHLAMRFYPLASMQQRLMGDAMERYRQNKEPLNPELFYVYWYNQELRDSQKLQVELQRLKKLNLPTDEMIANTLNTQANVFLQFVKEYYQISFSEQDETIARNAFLQNTAGFEEMIFSCKYDPAVRFLLFNLYKTEPTVLEGLYSEFKKNSEVQSQFLSAQRRWKQIQNKERKLITHVWQQTVKNVLKQKNSRFLRSLECLEKIKDLHLNDHPAVYQNFYQLIQWSLTDPKQRKVIEQKMDGLIDDLTRLINRDNVNTIDALMMAKIAKNRIFPSHKTDLLKEAIALYQREDAQARFNEIASLLNMIIPIPKINGLQSAVEFGTPQQVRHYLHVGFDPNVRCLPDNDRLLCKAIVRGNEAIVGLLLLKDAYSFTFPNDLKGPLILAIEQKNENIVRMLLKRRASQTINMIKENGETALTMALKSHQPKIIGLLLNNAKLDVNAGGMDNKPLTVAVKMKQMVMVDILLKMGAKINECDSQGQTALMIAVKDNNEKIVKLLIESGAELTLQDKKGKTAMDYCTSPIIQSLLLDSNKGIKKTL